MYSRSLILLLVFVAGCPRRTESEDAPSATASASAAPSAHPAASASPPAPAPTASEAAAPSASASAAAAESAAPTASATAAPGDDAGRLVVDGKAIQGGVLRAKVNGVVKHIAFPGHRTTILDDGEFLIGFGRTAAAKEKLSLTLADGTVVTREFDVEQRTYETDRINGLPKNQVDLDAATKLKLGKEESKIDELRLKFSKSLCFKEPFQWPVKGKITSRYGQPRILNGTDAGPHWGIDIVAPVGTSVHAPACGKVIYVEKDVPLSGNVVIIDHGHGLTSTLIHLDKFKVKVGDEVKKGEAVATVGLTGRTNGPHLDWRMNLYDIRVDAEQLAPPMK